MNPLRRLHFGCGRITPTGWINADIQPGEGVDLCCDVLAGSHLYLLELRFAQQARRTEYEHEYQHS